MDILPIFPTFRLLINKKGLKGKGTVSYPIFPFTSAFIFSKSDWLIQRSDMSKKGYDRILFCFIECYCLLPVFETSSSVNRKCGFLRLSAPLLPTYTHSLCNPTCHGYTRILCCGTSQTLYINWIAKNYRHTYWVHLLCSHACSLVSLDFIYKTGVERQNY